VWRPGDCAGFAVAGKELVLILSCFEGDQGGGYALGQIGGAYRLVDEAVRGDAVERDNPLGSVDGIDLRQVLPGLSIHRNLVF